MTTDPAVAITFFAALLLLFCGAAAAWEAIDHIRYRRAMSRQLRRRIGRYGYGA